MKNIFIHYPKCSTCQNAEKFLKENNLDYVSRDIKIDNPTITELTEWSKMVPIDRFFNTSGLVYRELKLAETRPLMSDQEKIAILATNGMLVKRPILISKEVILVGFKLDQYRKYLIS